MNLIGQASIVPLDRSFYGLRVLCLGESWVEVVRSCEVYFTDYEEDGRNCSNLKPKGSPDCGFTRKEFRRDYHQMVMIFLTRYSYFPCMLLDYR